MQPKGWHREKSGEVAQDGPSPRSKKAAKIGGLLELDPPYQIESVGRASPMLKQGAIGNGRLGVAGFFSTLSGGPDLCLTPEI